MRVRLAYGSNGLDVEVPSERTTVIEPEFRCPAADPVAALTAALRAPIGRPPLREMVRTGQRVAISICDGTRSQPRREMLAAILGEIDHVPAADVVIMIATGTHRGNTPAELEAMLGLDLLSRYRVVNHDARDAASLAHVGTISSGVSVSLNREFLAADIRITTGVVEPHFFAGFSGGPKMVAPGLAAIDTVVTLHDARRIGDPMATWGVTEGNPIHDDVREIARDGGRALRRRRHGQSRQAASRTSSPAISSPSIARRARLRGLTPCARFPTPSTSCSPATRDFHSTRTSTRR